MIVQSAQRDVVHPATSTVTEVQWPDARHGFARNLVLAAAAAQET
jgi:hypothetical protein